MSRPIVQSSAFATVPNPSTRQAVQVGREGLVSIYSGNRSTGSSSSFTIQLPNLLRATTRGDASLRPVRVLMVSSMYDIPAGYTKLYYREVNAVNVITLTELDLAPGCYSGGDIASALQTALVATSPNGWPYTVQFSAISGKLTIATNGPAGSRWGFGNGTANSYKMSNVIGLDDTGSQIAGCAEVTVSNRVIQLNPMLVHIMTSLPTNGYASHTRGPTNLVATVALTAAPYCMNDAEIYSPPTIQFGTWPNEASFAVHRMDLDPVSGTPADLNGTEWSIDFVSAAGGAY